MLSVGASGVYCLFSRLFFHSPITSLFFLSLDWLVGCFRFNGLFRQYFSLFQAESEGERRVGWLVGCFGFNGPLRQYFSLYRAVSQREGERGVKG